MRIAVSLLSGVAICFASFTSGPALEASAQTTPAPYKAPRTTFDQPDLSGVWSNSTLTPITRPDHLKDRSLHTEEEVRKAEDAVTLEIAEGNAVTDPNAPAEYRNPATAERPEFTAAGGAVGGYNRGWLDPGHLIMRVHGEPRTSLLTTPDGQFPQRKAQAPVYIDPYANGDYLGSFDSYETRDLGERCVIGFGRNGGPPMLPNGFYNNNYLIVQTPDAVVIQVEMNHDARIVRLNGKHRNDAVRPYFGDSIGWWEGDTLVVETTHIPASQELMGVWENLKVTERFTRVGEQRLHYMFTVEDATMWDQPWGGEYEFSPLKGVIHEYACHEGNHALPGILLGARFEEATATAKSKGGPAGKRAVP